MNESDWREKETEGKEKPTERPDRERQSRSDCYSTFLLLLCAVHSSPKVNCQQGTSAGRHTHTRKENSKDTPFPFGKTPWLLQRFTSIYSWAWGCNGLFLSERIWKEQWLTLECMTLWNWTVCRTPCPNETNHTEVCIAVLLSRS